MSTFLRRLFKPDYTSTPILFRFRSHTLFIIATIAVGLFTDLFLYGLVVPILPYMLTDRIHIPDSQIQAHVSALLAAYAAASFLLSPLAGFIGDRTSSRQGPFLGGLGCLIVATIMLFEGRSIAVLTIARLAQGASSAFVWTVGLAMAIDTVGPENLGKVMGTIFSFITIGELFAPVLGGILYKKAGLGSVAAMALAILVVDVVMRVIIIEKKVARRYLDNNPTLQKQERERQQDGHREAFLEGSQQTDDSAQHDNPTQQNDASEATESSPLLRSHDGSQDAAPDLYRIPQPQPRLIQRVPILYTLRSPRIVLALLIAFMQALIYGAIDATVPTHALSLFDFDALRSSLLFIPLCVATFIMGPLAGWGVDRYGPKIAGVVGYGYLAPIFVLLRLPVATPPLQNQILYGAILGLVGLGLGVVGAPAIVEAGAVVDKYYKRNPDTFGDNGPYAQLYAMNSMTFCLGLTLGPLIAGGLTESIGYGNMNIVLAVLSAVTAVACYLYFGGKPWGFSDRAAAMIGSWG